MQAIEFRRPDKSSEPLEKLATAFRKQVTFMDKDRLLHDDMMIAEQFLAQHPDNIIGS